MIPIPQAIWDAVQGSYITSCRIDSWQNGRLLSANIPVISGTYTADRSLQVPDSINITVPTEANGVRYDPLYQYDPLAPYGQRLRLSVGIISGGRMVQVPRGQFLITSTTHDGDTVTVQADNLLTLVAEASLVTPFQPAAGDTFKRVMRRLVEPAVPVVFHGLLSDRAVPVNSLQWDEDRLTALYELAAAWPAKIRIHSAGYLIAEPITEPDPDAWIADASEVVVRTTGTTSREAAINCVVARGSDETTGRQFQGVAYDTDGLSPTRWKGPFNPLPVPLFYYSPLLTSDAVCRSTAQALLYQRRRKSRRFITQDMSPVPFLELGDIIRTADGRAGFISGTVETITMPLTADDGPLTLGLAVIG